MPLFLFHFLKVFAGKAGKYLQKRMILGGPAALHTSRLPGDCISPTRMRRILGGPATLHPSRLPGKW
jgi:hypothetical protein